MGCFLPGRLARIVCSRALSASHAERRERAVWCHCHLRFSSCAGDGVFFHRTMSHFYFTFCEVLFVSFSSWVIGF